MANVENITVTIDSNPKTLKPILYTTYTTSTKYNIHIAYEDATSKDVELVSRDKNRLYRFVFKKEGKLITATGVPSVYEVSECSKMCDFANTIMDSNDLLIELDCSSDFNCTKVRFYLKDIRDIIDLANEPIEDPEDNMEYYPITTYPIYLNGYSCQNVIPCTVVENDGIFSTILTSQIIKIGEPLTKDQYKDFTIFVLDFDTTLTPIEVSEDELVDKVSLTIPEELLDTEIKLIIKYYINEIEHPVFDEFTIFPSKTANNADNGSNQRVLTRAVTTQDTQYLGDGLKPALGVGLTPSYKEYRNKKKYNDSVLDSAT